MNRSIFFALSVCLSLNMIGSSSDSDDERFKDLSRSPEKELRAALHKKGKDAKEQHLARQKTIEKRKQQNSNPIVNQKKWYKQ